MPKSKQPTLNVVEAFQQAIYEHYGEHGREFPWRTARDPYHILVSEIMLQQTQVERVILKYDQFVARFPDVATLAQAHLREILEVWQGLGYNRRALALQRIAHRVIEEFNGKIPDSVHTLQTFPGIGAATAGAIVAFAFNKASIFIETNIRRVFIHFFFMGRERVSDAEILPLVERTLDATRPRTWYYALMDYGAMLKRLEMNPNRRSAQYHRQSSFRDSNREIRGMILRALVKNRALSVKELIEVVGKSPARTHQAIGQLVGEALLVRTGNMLSISAGRDMADTEIV